MRTVFEACTPRTSIIKGTFNPEVFTASLSPVVQYYRTGQSTIDSIYTDGEAFFREATYPTQGIKETVSSVFRRISGDSSAPSIYRLETAFGGGKTHSLIACVHIAYQGTKLASVTADILDPVYLPEPGSVTVVGIAGDEIPVNKAKRDGLIPYTLWGEMAYQIGGEKLYQEVRSEAESFAAPGKHFLERILGGRKLLIMLDELAQYVARLGVAIRGGDDQLAAFLMTLNGYAKNNPGIAVILTLAGTADAFSKQTEKLTHLLNSIGAGDLSQDDALALAEKATKGVTSVTMRDATAVTPVQASEIASVLAKRLFTAIDSSAAREATDEYTDMYRRNSALLPEEAVSARFRDRLLSNYPFHPTLVDFLNQKLAQAENFQGTRGVLRVLAMTVRSLWAKKAPVSMIHTSDIDMQNASIVSELLGRTGSADLQLVLNADIGSADSLSLESGLSNAQRADLRNPHPDQIPLYEMTWKTVFLNSLVGRAEGHTSKLYGISQQDAIFAVATPLATPPQVRIALDAITEYAFYLRYEEGKYFAHLDPTINSVLAMIRQTVSDKQIWQELRNVATGQIRDDRHFAIEHDVRFPENIADGRDRLTLGVVRLDVDVLDPMQVFTTKGEGRPRERQNMVLLLVPKTTSVRLGNTGQIAMDIEAPGKQDAQQEVRQRVENTARQVLAIRALKERPQAFGIAPAKLRDPDFVVRERDSEFRLATGVSEMYTGLYYPSQGNSIVRKEIRSTGGEGGSDILGQVLQILRDDKMLIEAVDHTATALQSLADAFIFSGSSDRADVDKLLTSFYSYRGWPKLLNKDAFDRMIRDGVAKGSWLIYKMPDDAEATHPAELYTQESGIPMSMTLLGKGYSIMKLSGAKARGWLDKDTVPPEKVRDAVKTIVQASGAATIHDITASVQQQLGNATEDQIKVEVQNLIHRGGYSIYKGIPGQGEKPGELIDGFQGAYYPPAGDDVLISRQEQSERGWLSREARSFKLSGHEDAKKLLPLLKRFGSLYTRGGAASTINSLDITDLQLPSGGTLRVALENVGPADIKHLDEFFQILADVGKIAEETEAELVIAEPDENCPLIKELKK